MVEYEVGKYDEYYYRNIESVISDVLYMFQYRVMGENLYREIKEKLNDAFRALNMVEPYMDFDWEVVTGNDRIMIRFEDRVMKRVDICKIVFEYEKSNVEVWWNKSDEVDDDEYTCLLWSIDK